jgi:Mn-dependent DtxR family transcriptional regulator
VTTHPCVELTPGESRYLLAILQMQRSGGRVSQAALARAVGVSHPSALEMVRRLRQLGLVEPDALALTVEGTSAALVLRSRRSAARVLVHDILGLEGEQAELEAARLASSVSAELGRRLAAWGAAQRIERSDVPTAPGSSVAPSASR